MTTATATAPTSPNAKSLLFAAARKGKASASAKVRRHVKAGTWSDAVALDMLATIDAQLVDVEYRGVEHFRLAAQRAYVVAFCA